MYFRETLLRVTCIWPKSVLKCFLWDQVHITGFCLNVQCGWKPFAISSMTLMNFSSSSWELCVQASGRWADTILRSIKMQQKKNERLICKCKMREVTFMSKWKSKFFTYLSPIIIFSYLFWYLPLSVHIVLRNCIYLFHPFAKILRWDSAQQLLFKSE